VTHPVDRGTTSPVSGAARASSAGGITFQKKTFEVSNPARILQEYPHIYEGFLKCWYPTTFGFPTENDYFEVFWGVYGHFLKWWYPAKHPKVIIFRRKTHGCWVPAF